VTMPFIVFQLRMQAAAARKLSLIGALRAAEGGPMVQGYIESLQQAAYLSAPQTMFALVQSVDD
jgi:hypothetical protein